MCGLGYQKYLASKRSVSHTYLVWKGASRIRGNAGIGGRGGQDVRAVVGP
jgi:hypothetical protein